MWLIPADLFSAGFAFQAEESTRMAVEIYKEIREIILSAEPEISGEDFDIQPSPENQSGDFGLACFRFSKKLKNSPARIAEKLADLKYPAIISEVVNTGPYVNFTLDRTLFSRELIGGVFKKKDTYGSDNSGAGKKVILEHTSINPNASPHIGRARNGLIGDALFRFLRFEGYDVDVHYYVNDMGKQIGLLVLQTERRDNLQFEEILDLYVEANKRAEIDKEFEQRGLEMLLRMEKGEKEVVEAFNRILDICLEGQLKVLGRLGFSYNTFDRESSFIHDPRMDEVLKTLEGKGAIFVDDLGRKVADLLPLGYPREEGRYVVLVRANGSSMYMYRDIAYTLEKIDRESDVNLIVLGEDHKMYFEQMETIIRAMGKVPPEVIHYSYIILKEGKMSTRLGTVVLLEDFLDEAIKLARLRVDGQCPDLSSDEKAEIARMIGIGAVRFSILSVRPNRNVVFDWDTALSFTGDSGPYIQYSCTRIASILRKYGAVPDNPYRQMKITHNAEWNLIFRLALVHSDVSLAFKSRNPAIITTSALDIAKKFSIFYNECPVISAPEKEIRESRIAICIATRQVLQNLLGLIGIETPDRM